MIKKGIGVNSFTLGKRKADELLARPSGMPSSKRSVETPPERYCVQHQRDLQYIKALLVFQHALYYRHLWLFIGLICQKLAIRSLP